MSYTLVRTFNAGKSRSGLATVGYTLTGGSRSTAGVAEQVAGSGIYSAPITFADGFSGQLTWDTGEGAGTRYGVEAINPPAYGPAPEWYDAPDNTGIAVAAGGVAMLATMFEPAAPGAYRYTTAALANAPTGGGGGGGPATITGADLLAIADSIAVRDWTMIEGPIPDRCFLQAARSLRNRTNIDTAGNGKVCGEDDDVDSPAWRFKVSKPAPGAIDVSPE